MNPREMIKTLIELGFTQAEIGEAAGVDRSTVGRIANTGQKFGYETGESIKGAYEALIAEYEKQKQLEQDAAA